MIITDTRPTDTSPILRIDDIPAGVPFEAEFSGIKGKKFVLMKVKYTSGGVCGNGENLYYLNVDLGVIFSLGGGNNGVVTPLKVFTDHELILRG